MTDNLIKRLTAGATGAGNLPKDLYRKDCADALAEIERLRAELMLEKATSERLRSVLRDAGLLRPYQQSTITPPSQEPSR